MKIDLAHLTTCGVEPDGEAIELNFVDAAGTPTTLRMPFDNAQAVAMTLPRLLAHALRRITGQKQVRYVFPLGSWCIEDALDRDRLIVTFSTDDGFEASFGIPLEACRSLGRALEAEADGPRADDAAAPTVVGAPLN